MKGEMTKRCYVLLGKSGKFYGVSATPYDAWHDWTPLESWRAAGEWAWAHQRDGSIHFLRHQRLKSLGWRVKEAKVTW